MDLPLATVLTAGGAVAAAGLVTGVVEMLKRRLLPIIGARGWEPHVAFAFSLVLVVLAFIDSGVRTLDGAFLAFLGWYGIASIAMKIHDDVTSIRPSGTEVNGA